MSSDFKTVKCKYKGLSIDFILRKIEDGKYEIARSEFYTVFVSQLEQCCRLINGSDVKSIICYGLGKFSECILARYQLCLLLLLRERTKVNIIVSDPAFEDKELEIIRMLNLIAFESDNAYRKLDEISLVILPHCCPSLTNNLLAANWDSKLNNVILVCNSFQKISEDLYIKNFKKLTYMYHILPYIRELPIDDSFSDGRVFNNLSFHVLPKSVINLIKKNIWKIKIKPNSEKIDDLIDGIKNVMADKV